MILIWGNHRPIKLHCIVFLYCISFKRLRDTFCLFYFRYQTLSSLKSNMIWSTLTVAGNRCHF